MPSRPRKTPADTEIDIEPEDQDASTVSVIVVVHQEDRVEQRIVMGQKTQHQLNDIVQVLATAKNTLRLSDFVSFPDSMGTVWVINVDKTLAFEVRVSNA